MTASVSEPVSGGRGQPFSLPEADVAARGYIAEEFFLDGTATSYLPAPGATLGEDGRWDAVEDGVAEFRTRMLVVRPADPTLCNGTAVVHWLNVSAGYEKGTADDEELLSGFVWVGVSAQQVGIDGRAPGTPTSPGRSLPGDPLKTWDPQRCTTRSCRRSPRPVAPSSKGCQPACRSSTPRGATSTAASVAAGGLRPAEVGDRYELAEKSATDLDL